jgi:polyphosphate kinase
VFAAIRAGDLLVHHPYESFAASTQRFITQAATDPEVLSIKMTLYRTSGDSPIVRDLIAAAERGKQVVVLVEIKARFDEQANIEWARKLEQAGAHVVYGLVGLKTHSKTSLVVRREGSTLRRYVHIGTGNYNPGTAASTRTSACYRAGRSWGRRQRPVQRPDRPVAPARVPAPDRGADEPARLDPGDDRARDEPRPRRQARPDRPQAQLPGRSGLRRRSVCRLAGWGSDGSPDPRHLLTLARRTGRERGISVRSIVGQYLEHSRIFSFANDGRPEWYIGSADLMERNLDRRVEAIVPVEDPEAQEKIRNLIEVMLSDDRRSWQLGADGVYHRTEELTGVPGTIDTFETPQARALASIAVEAAAPHRPHAGAGSLDPRA